MQIVKIYSVYDRKSQYYLPIFQSRSDNDAIRSFQENALLSDTPLSKYPADYDLVLLGAIDNSSGRLAPEFPPTVLINGLVALQAAQTERARYQALLSQPQMDIEDIIAQNP